MEARKAHFLREQPLSASQLEKRCQIIVQVNEDHLGQLAEDAVSYFANSPDYLLDALKKCKDDDFAPVARAIAAWARQRFDADADHRVLDCATQLQKAGFKTKLSADELRILHCFDDFPADSILPQVISQPVFSG